MMRPSLFSVAAVAALLPTGASAQAIRTAQDLSTTRALAMGDAFRAVPNSNDAIYFNLAGMALAPRYELNLTWAFNDGNGFDLYNGSIVDAKSTTTPTGLAYSRMVGDDLNGHVVNLGFAFGLGGLAALGVGLKYLNFSEPDSTNAVTGDVGLIIRPVEILTLGVATYNVIGVSSPEAPRRAAAGVAFGSERFLRVASDVVFDFSGAETDRSYHLGGEFLLLGMMPLRAGYKWIEATDDQYFSAGIGFVSQEAGFEAAWVQNVDGDRSDDRTFSFTLKLFL